MQAPDWLYTDPIPARTKGWMPKAGGGVKLRQAYLSSAYGSGADSPPVRDDWSLGQTGTASLAPSPVLGGSGLTDETAVSAPQSTSPSTPDFSIAGAEPIPPAPINPPKPQPIPNAQSGFDWQSNVSPDGEVGAHDHSNDNPQDVNKVPPAGAQLAGDGTWLTSAESQLGRGYVWGGKDPKTGFDCSGYASWILQQQGRPYIGSSTMTMFPNTVPVNDPQPGDLVFYNMESSDPHMQHVAVYIGNGQVIQSGGTKSSINIASVNQPVGSAPIFRRPKGQGPVSMPGQPPSSTDQSAASVPQGSPQGAPQEQPQPDIPQNSSVKNWFSYVDNGREVMEIEWDNGQTTFHELGDAQGDDGTVIQTGTLGGGADSPDPKVGAGADDTGDDQTEWPIPPSTLGGPDFGSAPTTTPAPPPPTRDDWNRQPSGISNTPGVPAGTQSSTTNPTDQTEWPTPSAPVTASLTTSVPTQAPASSTRKALTPPPAQADASPADTTSAPSADGTAPSSNTSENQTEWSIPAPVQSLWQGASGAIGGAVDAAGQAVSSLVASPQGPTPAGSQPTPSDSLTNPVEYAKRNEPPMDQAVPDLSERLPQIQLAPQGGTADIRPITPQGVVGTPQEQLTPVGRAAAGETVNPFDVKNQATEGLADVITPDDVPARDWFKTGVATALDPSMMEGGIENELGNVALKGAGRVVKAAAKAVPDAVSAAADKLWDPLTHTFQQSWDRLMPDVVSRAPASVQAQVAADVGGAAAGASIEALTDDPNDPNKWAKVVAAGGAGLAATHMVMNVTPAVVDALKKELAPAMRLPGPVRDAISARANRLNASRGENWLWANRIEDVLGKPGKAYNTLDFWQYVEENGKAPPGANTQVQQLVDDMVKYTNDTRDEGQRLGYIRGDITTRPDARGVTLQAYMPRVLKSNQATKDAFPGVWHGKLNPKDTFSHMRQYVSIQDIKDAGLIDMYENAPSRAFGHYAEHVNASRANALFIKDLKKMAPGSIARIKSPKNVSMIGNGDWIWGGHYLKQWQNVAFSPELKTVLDNITGSGAESPLWRGALNLAAEAKAALFAPSLFHLGNEVRQVFNSAGFRGLGILPKTAFYMIPGAGQSAARKFWTNPSVIDAAREAMDAGLVLMRRMPDIDQAGLGGIKGKAAQAGWGAVTAGSAGYMNARFDSSLSEEDRIKRGLTAAGLGAAGGLVGGALSHMLWSDTVPYMKLMTWQLLAPKYGKEAAATFVNSVYGGQNLEAIARSRKVQDALRTVVLAPDWQEGWIRQIGNAFLPGPVGDMNRAYWARAGVTSAFMLEGLNLAINGHATNDNGPGHELTLETTGLYDRMGWDHTDTETGEKYRTYVDLLGPYRGMLNAPLNPGAFLSARQGLIPEELGTALSGKDWRGKDIAPPGASPAEQVGLKAAYLLSRLAPVGPAEITRVTGQSSNEPLPLQVGLSVAGLRETRQSPLQLAVQQRDEQYRQAGITVEQEQQLNTTYTGLLKQAERNTGQAFDPSKKHGDIVKAVQEVDWPTRQNLIETLEPPQIASDPVKNADWITKIRGIQSIGTQSSEAPADVDMSQLPMDAITSAYWSPPGKTTDQMASLPADAQDRARESALVQQALLYKTDPNALRDVMKAQARGQTLPPLPGVSSSQLDEWANQWRTTQDPDVQVQSQKRRDLIDQIAAEHNLDPNAVYQRIKTRNLPLVHEDPNEPGISADEKQRREMQVSYERAQDALYNSKDPSKFPAFANPDGTAYKGSSKQQWDQWTQQIAADTKAGKRTHTPEVQALIQAKQAADAARSKALLKDPAGQDYQRWYGVGRNMDEAHWQQYVSGQGHQFVDINDPTENRRRTRTLELWNASTPQERLQTKVKIKVVVNGQVRDEVTTLDQAKKHIDRAIDPAWKTDLGLDTTGVTQ